MNLPQDSNMLVSIINMKLRDGGYDSLSDLCLSEGIDEKELTDKLGRAGFIYNAATLQFR